MGASKNVPETKYRKGGGPNILGICPDTLEKPLRKPLPLGKPLGTKNGWLQESLRAQIQERKGVSRYQALSQTP